MNAPPNLEEVPLDDFTRRFKLRAKSLMWFLGAGASASAGIPTAADLTWLFKQELFVSQRGVPRQAVENLGNEAIRRQLQAHIDTLDQLPKRGSPEEYAALFERAFPTASDRQRFMKGWIRDRRPSYGHYVLGALMASNRTNIIWTTNFDPLVHDASVLAYGSTGPLTTVDLDRAHLGREAVSGERWPVEIKLHGDFRSSRISNTRDELRDLDEEHRQLLVDSSRRFGLVVIGYSGRDKSVMKTLSAALREEDSFPHGLFWLHRQADGAPADSVRRLLNDAANRGIESALVRIYSFDEAMRGIARICNLSDQPPLDDLKAKRGWRSFAPRLSGTLGGPGVRLNALQVTEYPRSCRRVVCSIGGYSEVRDALAKASADFPFARVRSGVLIYGDDASIRDVFDQYSVSKFDEYPIEIRRLRYDSHERGLMCDALVRAICRVACLDYFRRRGVYLLAPAACESDRWTELRKIVKNISGTVPKSLGLKWREGVAIRLAWADDKLWLLVEPRIVFDGLSGANKAAAAEFALRRTSRRYNLKLNQLIGYWAKVFANVGDLRAIGTRSGIDAHFGLSNNLAISERLGA